MVPHEHLAEAADNCGDRTALVDPKGEVTFAELYELTRKLASGLHSEGIRRGDIVAVLIPNSITFALTYYAASYLGAVFMPIDPRLVAAELDRIMKHAEPCALIVSARFRETVSALSHQPPLVIWSDQMKSSDVSVAPASVDPDDTLAIMYTSGTTGIPKGAVVTAKAWDAFPAGMEAHWSIGKEDIGLLSVPMSHLSGPVYLNACVSFALEIVIMDRFSPRTFVKKIAEYRITFCHLAPAMLNMINRLPEDEDIDISSLKLFATFGAVATPEVVSAFEKRFRMPVDTGYGLTEAAPLVSGTELGKGIHKPYTVGKPVAAAGANVRIINGSGETLPAGEVGEITISGPMLMKEYYKNPEATREILRDGWLYTGDLGRFDEEGYLYIVGRKKDMIIVGGLNVYAAEVESVLRSHPSVSEAAVVGDRDDRASERVIAYVVLDDSATADAVELKALCRQSLATYKVPANIHFIDEMPKTSTGKVDKTKFRERVFDEPST